MPPRTLTQFSRAYSIERTLHPGVGKVYVHQQALRGLRMQTTTAEGHAATSQTRSRPRFAEACGHASSALLSPPQATSSKLSGGDARIYFLIRCQPCGITLRSWESLSSTAQPGTPFEPTSPSRGSWSVAPYFTFWSAVVLESQAQYEAAGLEPIDSSQTATHTVPEPGNLPILFLGDDLLIIARKRILRAR